MRRRVSCIAVSCIFLVACAPQSPHTDPMQQSKRSIRLHAPDGSVMTLQVDVADTPEEREKGLMYRKGLAENEGMVFIFQEQQPLSFWMKNTLIPLDVLFFDAVGNFLSAQSMVPCTSDPCNLYPSGQPTKYALEVGAGFVKMKGVGEGWKIAIEDLGLRT